MTHHAQGNNRVLHTIKKAKLVIPSFLNTQKRHHQEREWRMYVTWNKHPSSDRSPETTGRDAGDLVADEMTAVTILSIHLLPNSQCTNLHFHTKNWDDSEGRWLKEVNSVSISSVFLSYVPSYLDLPSVGYLEMVLTAAYPLLRFGRLSWWISRRDGVEGRDNSYLTCLIQYLAQ